MSDKVIYTGHFVEDPADLISKIPPRIDTSEEGAKLHAHHLTKEFKPKDGTESITVGKKRILHAIGEVSADGVHAILVKVPDGEQITANEFPHITIATAPGVSPVKSNEVIAAAHEAGTVMPIEPPIEINVVEGYFNGKQPVTN